VQARGGAPCMKVECRMEIRFAARALAAALVCGSLAQAQTIQLAELGYAEDGGDAGFAELQELQGDPSEDEPEAKPSKPGPRVQKLQQMNYDRRPSAILAAWAKVRESSLEPSGDAGDVKTGQVFEPTDGAVLAGSVSASGATITVISAVPALPLVSVQGGALPATGTIALSTTMPATSTAASGTPVGVATLAATSVAATAATPNEPAPPSAEVDATAAEDDAERKAEQERQQAAAAKKAIDAELKTFAHNVTLGDWSAVKASLAGWQTDEQKAGYDRLLASLVEGPRERDRVPPQGQQHLEKNQISPADVLGLASACPAKPSDANLAALGQLLAQSLEQGHQLSSFLALVKARIDEPDFAVDRRRMARILVGAGKPEELEPFLPTLEEAEAKADREGLNLISRLCLARHAKDARTEWLERAWRATQAVLAVGEVSENAKSEAISRAVELAPKLRAELGGAWLDESFTARPERGMEILAAIGSTASKALSMAPMDADRRLRLLELQSTAARALLRAAPELATSWQPQLSLLAANWLREATWTYSADTSTSLGPQMRRDMYGNFFFYDDGNDEGGWNGRGNAPVAIKTAKVLDTRPSDAWMDFVEPTLRPRLAMAYAQLYLKVGEEADAFPYIEKLAATDPIPAKSLVDEFLRVWARKHNPNQNQGRSNPYVYMYGFDQRANAIPLTRSKQERALAELGQWVARMRALNVEVDQKLVASAFRAAHSQAEIYRLETLEQIFGAIDALAPETLAQLVGAMRTNLVGVWRDPALQKEKGTQRKQKDIEQEVLRGYALAQETLRRALEKHADAWQLWSVLAALEHDENQFRYEFQKDPQYSAKRTKAFESFARAAQLYAASLPSAEPSKDTAEVFETWFYAALGASDLNRIDAKTQLAQSEIARIKTALDALPADRIARHIEMFGNALTTRIGSCNPAVKSRYVRQGLAITGETKITRDLQQLASYYGDLVTEIQLRATVDGASEVGHKSPFGLAIDLRHTTEIERESGGFSKYLQNQNSQNYAWNYGRPLEDYRDKFEEAVRETLKERFDVLSVTFNQPEARSKPDAQEGWRVTPYAYVLLQPRGPEVDRIPPLKLDLDFLDTSGYCVLPIESRELLIDAKPEAVTTRPFERLALVQTLDERQAKTGKLVLEIKATAVGLVPTLDELVTLAPVGFDIASKEERPVSISKFDDDGVSVLSERLWTITFRGKEGLAKLPETFAFATPRVPTATSEHFRYVDADLAAVGPEVELEYDYGDERALWPWWVGGTLALGAFTWFLRRSKPQTEARGPRARSIPEPLTPFSALGFLRDVHEDERLDAQRRAELAAEIAALERAYFGSSAPDARPDLANITRKWASTAP
jgi:hypothetical protein